MSRLTLDDELWILSHSLQDFVGEAFDEARRDHPLLARVPQLTGHARRLEVPADVCEKQPEIARYEIPRLVLTSRFRLPDSMEREAVWRWASELLGQVTAIYGRDTLRRLYQPPAGLLGLDGLAPRTVGANLIGGISEATMPGWRSRLVRANRRAGGLRGTAYDSLVRLSSRLPGGNNSLVIVGEQVFSEIFGNAKLFIVSIADPRLIAFNRGHLYRDPHCQPDDAFVVPTGDLLFYSTPPAIQLARVPDASFTTISIRSGEQLVAQRRFGLGRVLIPTQAG
jgi:hypothetical protein